MCPYHSWSYRLDGRLRNAPQLSKVDEGFDADQFGLAELRLVNWHGWLFVDPSGEDADFAEHVAGWEEIIAPYRPEDLTVVDRHSYELGHQLEGDRRELPGVLPLLDDPPRAVADQPAAPAARTWTPTGSWIGGWMSLIDEAETMSLSGASGGVAIKGLSEHELRTVMYVVGYPNLSGQPAPRLRDDPPDDAAGRRPHPRRVRVGVPERGRREAGLRSVIRGRLLGPDQPSGLGRVRIGAARPSRHRTHGLGRSPPTRTACTSSSAGSLRRIPAALLAARHPVDALDRLGVGADHERHSRGR